MTNREARHRGKAPHPHLQDIRRDIGAGELDFQAIADRWGVSRTVVYSTNAGAWGTTIPWPVGARPRIPRKKREVSAATGDLALEWLDLKWWFCRRLFLKGIPRQDWHDVHSEVGLLLMDVHHEKIARRVGLQRWSMMRVRDVFREAGKQVGVDRVPKLARDEVRGLGEQRVRRRMWSSADLWRPSRRGDDDGEALWYSFIGDMLATDDGLESVDRTNAVRDAVDRIPNERTRFIARSYYLDQMVLLAISKMIGMTESGVGQIIKREVDPALRKMLREWEPCGEKTAFAHGRNRLDIKQIEKDRRQNAAQKRRRDKKKLAKRRARKKLVCRIIASGMPEWIDAEEAAA